MRAFLPFLALAACNGADSGVADAAAPGAPSPARVAAAQPFRAVPMGTFNEPWAMAIIPGTPNSATGGQPTALITEKGGRLLLRNGRGQVTPVSGVPRVAYGGQGGLGDVVLHPDYGRNGLVYLSYVEGGPNGTKGAVVGRGRLLFVGEASRGGRVGAQLQGFQPIWRQAPKVEGDGHFAHRIAFGPDGKLYISSGDRQKFTPAQDMVQNLGKIVRLNDDGSVPADNPFAARGGVAAQIWSLGHRNPLGIAFAPDGKLWEHEMGPRGGDEFNLIERGSNYGYPIVSNGDHYDGREIPDHPTRPEFNAPETHWTPVISPAGLAIYTGDLYPGWRGDALVGGLSSEALIRVDISGNNAREAERYPMGKRIREVEQGPDGYVYLLEDGEGGRLLRLEPTR